jgi:DNA invertase Pin-like site-specific DNA recombinase
MPLLYTADRLCTLRTMSNAPNTPAKRRRRRTIDYSQLPLIAYCRTSKDGGEKGVSIEDQEHQLRAWAAARGVEITVQHDAGQSGSRMENRPGLQAALAEIETGRAGGIVAIKLDRLGRDAVDVLGLAKRAKAEGWRLVSLDVGLDSADPVVGEMVMGMLAVAAQFALGRMTEVNRETANQLRRAGRPRNQFTKADTEIADQIVAMRDDGMSYRQIAADLQERGVPTVRGGITWRASSVKSAEVARRLEIKALAAA